MEFNDLSNLGTSVINVSLMDEIITLIRQNRGKITQDEREIVERSLEYLKLIQNGYNFFNKGIHTTNVEKALTAFNSTMIALKLSKTFNDDRLIEITNESIKEINEILDTGSISNIISSLELFTSLGKHMLKQGLKIANKKIFF